MIYLFYGPDEFSQREALRAVRQRMGDDDFNVTVLRPEQATVNAIVQSCDTVPFLGDRRMVIVDGLPLKKKAKKAADPVEGGGESTAEETPSTGAFARDLTKYLPRVPEATDLVIVAEDALDAQSVLVKAATALGKAKATVTAYGKMDAADLPGWVERRVRAAGATIQGPAASLLAQFVGNDLRRLAGEVEKLALYVDGRRPITSDDVRLLVPDAINTTIFVLTDALGNRQGGPALRCLHELLATGSPPPLIIAMIDRHLANLIQVRDLLDRRIPETRLAAEMGVSSWLVGKLTPQAKRFTMPQLRRLHELLLELDVATKRSKVEPTLGLDLLIARATLKR